MIRTKAKNILLSIMLLCACCVFFACKKEDGIKVDKIEFVEQSISLLVGESYEPEIKILPSYATSRSYTLISMDATALDVEGGKITALKAGLDIKLKVVSTENENVNDVISVFIYNEATELETPTDLRFDGNKLTFDAKDNANSYTLKVNGKEINIGNNIEYDFENIIASTNVGYNQIITCSVKTVGDGKIFKDSPYSEGISFVKLAGVSNSYVENQILYFDQIQNVVNYSVDIVSSRGTETVSSDKINFVNNKANVNLAEFILDSDKVDGAEYTINISPSRQGYIGIDEGNVFVGQITQVEYKVLGQVQNVNISNKFISWDFVKNAESYTIELYKNGLLDKTYENLVLNYFEIENYSAGEYVCQISACTTEVNSLSSQIKSNELQFIVLQAPKININSNIISWNTISGAEGYLVTIKDIEGVVVDNIHNKFVVTNTYNVNQFNAGEYSIEVCAYGNGHRILTSQQSEVKRWTILQNVNMTVANEVVSWTNFENEDERRYQLIINGEVVNLPVLNDINVNNRIDFNDGSYINYLYDGNAYKCYFAGYKFEPGQYEIGVRRIGSGNVFDSKIQTLSIIKLPVASFDATTPISNKQFTIVPVDNAVGYKVEVFAEGELDSPIQTLVDMVDYKFNLNANVLDAGKYVAKVSVYGNNENIFDADNDNSVIVPFEKLETPQISIDYENLKLSINSTSCVIYEMLGTSETIKTYSVNEYDLSVLSSGTYTYSVKDIGNNKDILDSDVTLDADVVKVKKLINPTLEFNQSTRKFIVSCNDEALLNDSTKYTFKLNGENILVNNGIADCGSKFIDSGVYNVEVFANPKSVTSGYDGFDLVITSNIETYSVTKLNGATTFKIVGGKLQVTPSDTNIRGVNYVINLLIENGDNDIVLSDFESKGPYYQTDLFDSNYNVRDELKSIMSSSGEYEIWTSIDNTAENILISNSIQCTNTLKILNKVNAVGKSQQGILFDVIDDKDNYEALIKVNGVENKVNISSLSLENNKNKVSMADLLDWMNGKVEYCEQTEYSIRFVATKVDETTIPNRTGAEYKFKFLKAPELSFTEDNNAKYLNIESDDNVISEYAYMFDQDMTILEGWKNRSGQVVTIGMDSISTIAAGKVTVRVYSHTDTGDYFDSKQKTIEAYKLNTPELGVEDGVLTWANVDSLKQYNLLYNGDNVIELTDGVDKFTVVSNVCHYDFEQLVNDISFELKAISQLNVGGTYYLNSNVSEQKTFHKLVTPTIEVVNGRIKITFTKKNVSDSVEICVDGVKSNLDITTSQDGVDVEINELTYTCIIEAHKLLDYITTNLDYGLLAENISIEIKASNNTTLNSKIVDKNIKGLLAPTGLSITKSYKDEDGLDTEKIEKITWANPTQNGNNVNKYEISVKYGNDTYKFISNDKWLLMPKYYDANSNGILDAGDVEFGVGTYIVKVRALTNNSIDIVNSAYCAEINIVVLDSPKKLTVNDGNIVWANTQGATKYLIRVYLLSDNSLIATTTTNINKYDLTSLPAFVEGIYGVTIQARHNSPLILSSEESDVLQVVRLPQVKTFEVDNGELYIYIHNFYTKAEIYLRDKTTGAVCYSFPLENQNLEAYNNFVNDMTDWNSSNIIATYTNNLYINRIKYEGENAETLLNALAGDYKLSVKLYGNTITLTDENVAKGAIISGHDNILVNKNNVGVEYKNIVSKLPIPQIQISEAERGVFEFKLFNSEYPLKYYNNGTYNLEGVHLYELSILADDWYTVYVAEITNNLKFKASLLSMQLSISEKAGLSYFEYEGIVFNIVTVYEKEATHEKYVKFDFNKPKFEYIDCDEQYAYITLSNGGSFVAVLQFMGDDSKYISSDISEGVEIKRYEPLTITASNGVLSWKNLAVNYDEPIYIIRLVGSVSKDIVLYDPDKYTEEELRDCLGAGDYVFDYIKYAIYDMAVIDWSNTTITFASSDNPNLSVTDTFTTSDGGNTLISNQFGELKINANTLSYTIQSGDISIKLNSTSKIPGASADIYMFNNEIIYGGLSEILGTDIDGAFNVSIKAHYTDATANDKILAQDGTVSPVWILPSADISLVKGKLTWDLAYVETNGGQNKEYMYDYLLEVIGDNEYYSIELNELNYSINNNRASYQLPEYLNNGIDGEFAFTPQTNYKFKLTALSKDDNGYKDGCINSYTSITNDLYLLPKLENFAMVDGKLTWSNPTSNRVIIKISYELPDTSIVNIEIPVNNGINEFELPDRWMDIGGTSRDFVSNVAYQISAYIEGSTSEINSFDVAYDDSIHKMNSIISNTITAEDGILKWNAVGGAEWYSIEYTHTYNELQDDGETIIEKTITGTIDNIENAEFDFADYIKGEDEQVLFNAGTIKVKIFAHSSNNFKSDESVELEFVKLIEPYNIKKNGIIISWDPVENATGYKLRIKQGEDVVDEVSCETSTWTINGIDGTAFSVAIKAITSNEGMLNSNYSAYYSMTIPESVDASTFKFDKEEQVFTWQRISDYSAGDKYYIAYDYYAPANLTGEATYIETGLEITEAKSINGEIYYYFRPTTIGTYKNIRVQVRRAGNLTSQYTFYSNAEGVNLQVFDIFALGNGDNGSPYIISSEQHLRNVKYFPSANYKLDRDIDISYVMEDKDNEGVYKFNPILGGDFVFSGVLDGNGKTIQGDNQVITLFNDSYIALFAKSEGATFKNFTLSGIKINGSRGSQYSYVGLLVAYANMTRFENIIITNGNSISFTASTSSQTTIYMGIICGYAVECEFNSCTISDVNINISLTGTANMSFAFGALAGYTTTRLLAQNNKAGQTAESNEKAFELIIEKYISQGGANLPNVYAGSLIGYAYNTEITNINNSLNSDFGDIGLQKNE
ncbi:MAG: hypothetical protein ACLRFE_01970 [Clostridia bacterium]